MKILLLVLVLLVLFSCTFKKKEVPMLLGEPLVRGQLLIGHEEFCKKYPMSDYCEQLPLDEK